MVSLRTHTRSRIDFALVVQGSKIVHEIPDGTCPLFCFIIPVLFFFRLSCDLGLWFCAGGVGGRWPPRRFPCPRAPRMCLWFGRVRFLRYLPAAACIPVRMEPPSVERHPTTKRNVKQTVQTHDSNNNIFVCLLFSSGRAEFGRRITIVETFVVHRNLGSGSGCI